MVYLKVLIVILVMVSTKSASGSVQRNVATGVHGSVINSQNGDGGGSSSIVNSGSGYSTSTVNGITTGWCEHTENGNQFIIHFKLKDGKMKVLDVDGDKDKLQADPLDAVNKCFEKAEKEKVEGEMQAAMTMEETKKQMKELGKDMDNMKEDMSNMFNNMFSHFGR